MPPISSSLSRSSPSRKRGFLLRNGNGVARRLLGEKLDIGIYRRLLLPIFWNLAPHPSLLSQLLAQPPHLQLYVRHALGNLGKHLIFFVTSNSVPRKQTRTRIDCCTTASCCLVSVRWNVRSMRERSLHVALVGPS